jgi:hypothetical protein
MPDTSSTNPLSDMEKGQAQPEALIPQSITGPPTTTWASQDETLNSSQCIYSLKENEVSPFTNSEPAPVRKAPFDRLRAALLPKPSPKPKTGPESIVKQRKCKFIYLVLILDLDFS